MYLIFFICLLVLTQANDFNTTETCISTYRYPETTSVTFKPVWGSGGSVRFYFKDDAGDKWCNYLMDSDGDYYNGCTGQSSPYCYCDFETIYSNETANLQLCGIAPFKLGTYGFISYNNLTLHDSYTFDSNNAISFSVFMASLNILFFLI